MSEEITIKKRRAFMMAYMDHTGPYYDDGYSGIFKSLYDWADRNKAQPGFIRFAIYLDIPGSLQKDEYRSELGVKVRKGMEEGRVKIRELPKRYVASVRVSGSIEEHLRAFSHLYGWIDGQDLVVAGPPMELFTNKPAEENGHTVYKSRIEVPVKGS